MKFPLPLIGQLTSSQVGRWHEYYVRTSDRDRTQEEGIWRRTQTSHNAASSGWRDDEDQRRRIVHYAHQYALRTLDGVSQLTLAGTRIYHSLALPADEIALFRARMLGALVRGSWSFGEDAQDCISGARGDLQLRSREYQRHPEDSRSLRKLPPRYSALDVEVWGGEQPNVDRRLPWRVLQNGMRIPDVRGHPTSIPDLKMLGDFSPFHLEIGCGVSLEAGVPPLHHLHDLYRVTDGSDGRFRFGCSKDDLIETLIERPRDTCAQFGKLFVAAFVAEPTIAHRALLALVRAGRLLAPVMTNNFDGLTHRAGIKELFLRRYDEAVPDVAFDPSAKALLVIGSHADRRRVQRRARAAGLQVIFLDPEGYWNQDRFVPYPLEGPQDGDLVCGATASKGLAELCIALGVTLS